MESILVKRIGLIREFNRAFARKIGLLQEGLLESPYSLTEARVLFEIGSHTDYTASDLAQALGLDMGHLSRILARLQGRGLITKRRPEHDGRQKFLYLTTDGQAAFDLIHGRANNQVAEMLGELSEDDQKRLLKAMFTIEEILLGRPSSPRTYILRQHEPGDLGWILYRHGVLYAEEYGWNEEFETLVATICRDFLAGHDPKRERCWIAEMDGEIIGSVMIAKSKQKNVAQLRVLLVEPPARGTGLGHRLVAECVKFSRLAGYRRIRLWTYSVLESARSVYEKAGFKLVNEEERHDFSHDLVGQTWELKL